MPRKALQLFLSNIIKVGLHLSTVGVLILGLLAQPGSAHAAGIIYVNQNNHFSQTVPSGTSWNDAFIDLQDGLNKAQFTGGEIWVAAGIYHPGSNNRAAAFQMVQGAAVYGGFSGNETSRDQRSPADHPVILSGDLEANDSGIVSTSNPSRGENSYHVVIGANNAVLDGFTITAGNANAGVYPDNAGGGLLLISGNMTLANITLSQNSAIYGGGIYTDSNSTLNNISFIDNQSSNNGAGMYSTGSPSMNNLAFTANKGFRGGGIYNGGTFSLTNGTFEANEASSGGGIQDDGSSTLLNLTFNRNKASLGGGLYSSGNTVIKNSILWGDTNFNNSTSEIEGTPSLSNSLVQGGFTGALDLDPLLGLPGSYGGSTPIIPLLPGSPAINRSSADCPAADQRGIIRGATCDLGAFESQGFTIEVSSGNLQAATINTGYALPLIVKVTAEDPLEPVTGGEVTFSTYHGGPNVQFSHSEGVYAPSTRSIGTGGEASETAAANETSGDVTVEAAARGAGSPAVFQLVNISEILYPLHAAPDGVSSGSCASWTIACSLDFAMSAAGPGGEIWVKEGTYTPNAAVSGRSASFQLISDVALYGGFAGTEDTLAARDYSTYISILSGDLNGDDGADFTNYTDNSFHVVTDSIYVSGARLDGFTISGGNAGMDFSPIGGGIYTFSSPVLANLVLTDNHADMGGGIYSMNNPALTNVTFRGNSANYGGGYFNHSGNPSLLNVSFISNTSIYEGGGMVNYSTGHPSFTNITFDSNRGRSGGGIFNNGAPVLTNITFSGNQATSGGGMLNDRGNPTLTHVTFKGNSAINNGDGLYTNYSLNMNNSILWGNNNEEIFIDDSLSPTVSISKSVIQGGCPAAADCTSISSLDPLLGELGNYGGSTRTVPLLPGSPALDGADTNCPAKDQRGLDRGAECDLGAFESQGFVLTMTGGDGQEALINGNFQDALTVSVTANIDIEPVSGGKVTFTPPASGASAVLKTNPAVIGSDGSASVTASANGSPGAYTVTSVTAGASTSLGFDLTNNASGTIYVKPGGLTSGSCSSWSSACSLLYGLAGAGSGQEIWAMQGTYKPAGSGGSRSATFKLNGGAALYGGFAGTETNLSERDPNANITILSGDLNSNDSGAASSLIDNVYHVVTIIDSDTSTTLDGFTIKSGNANNGGNTNGGGLINEGSPVLANLIFINNSANAGGGMYNSGNPSLTRITFTNNTAYYGGGMGNNGDPDLSNVTFSGNTARNGGGFFTTGNPSLTDTSFSANTALSGNGGGMLNEGSPSLTNISFTSNQALAGGGLFNIGNPALTNVTFYNNQASDAGGMYTDGSPVLVNTTFYANTARNSGGGILTAAEFQLKNSILWGDTVDGAPGEIEGTVIVSSSIVEGGYTGAGSLDPLLGAPGSYGGSTNTIPLLPGSPAIDGAASNCPAKDQRGVSRGSTCSLGAFESQGFLLEMVDGDSQSTGVGTGFSKRLQVSVTPNDDLEPVEGGKVTFTPPASGASAVIKNSPAVIDADGLTSVTASANSSKGAYSVTVSAAGAGSSIGFDLTNLLSSAVTDAADNITSGSASLNGTVNADNESTAVEFEYGLTNRYGNTVAAIPAAVSGAEDTAVSKTISGLTPGTTYHFRVKAVNSYSTIYGSDMSFTTLDASVSLVFHDDGHNAILSAAAGDRLHPNVEVSGTGTVLPTGSVSFTAFQNTSCSGSGSSSGSAALDDSGIADDPDSLTMTNDGLSYLAYYSGDANYPSGSSPCTAISTSPYLTVLISSSTTKPADGAVLTKKPASLLIQFSQAVLHDDSAQSVTNPENYLLVASGENGVFDTLSCGPVSTGGLKPDDTAVSVDSITYDEDTFLASLKINSNKPLKNGLYELFICGTTSITDPAETMYLNNHEADSVIHFSMAASGNGENSSQILQLPKTGFAPSVKTVLPKQPSNLDYNGTGLQLWIPRLGVSQPVTGVPQNSDWDVTWLGSSIGYLQGTAFPTWNGNSVLTGHSSTSEGAAGPFARLGEMKWGEQVILQAWGQEYIYEVRSVDLTVNPDAVSFITRHENRPWLTMITCRGYDAGTSTYRWRTVVRAVLVSVR